MDLFSIVAPLAETQLGLVTRRQLLALGVSPNTIAAAVRRGRLRRVARGVYAVPGAPNTAHSRLLAAILAADPSAVASHGTAAWLWELGPAPDRHHVTVPRHRRVRASELVVHESRDLDLVIPGTRHGVPVTDVGRTILDCARDRRVDLECMIDEARRRHAISDSLLPWVVHRHARRGRAGVVRLRELVMRNGLPASDFERLVTRWLRANNLAEWTLHHRIVLDGFGPVELDIAWPRHKVVLELEGADHRDRRLVHDHDTVRQNHLLLAGWRVLRVTYGRWLRDPDGLLHEVRDALSTATASAA